MRVRCFTQDDAHIFMTHEQITDEIKGVVRLIDEVYQTVWLQIPCRAVHHARRTRMGADEDWEMATNGLRTALDELGMPYDGQRGRRRLLRPED